MATRSTPPRPAARPTTPAPSSPSPSCSASSDSSPASTTPWSPSLRNLPAHPRPGHAGHRRLVPRLPGLLRPRRQAHRGGRLQAHHGHLALHHGVRRAPLRSRRHGQLPATLAAIFVLATGVCALQTSANPYVSILGPEHSAPARLTLAQAFNSLGSPSLPGSPRTSSSRTQQVSTSASAAHRSRAPTSPSLRRSFCSPSPLCSSTCPPSVHPRLPARQRNRPRPTRSIWTYTHTVLGMVGIFFYVGVEIALAAITIQLLSAAGHHQRRNRRPHAGPLYVLMMIGRFLGSFVMMLDQGRKAPRHPRPPRRGSAVRLHVHPRPGRHLEPGPLRHRQLRHVPQHLCPRHRRTRPLTSKGSGVITIGNFGGAVIPLAFGCSPTTWASSTPSSAHRRLPLRRLLRPLRLQTQPLSGALERRRQGPPAFAGGP